MTLLPLTSIEDLPLHTSTWMTWCVEAGLAEPLHIDAYVCRGEQVQPLALITAGVHGDEYEGPAAIAALARRLNPQTLAGSVIAVPVVNPMAFAAAQRLSPDGGNLARTFPGVARGNPTERLAAWFFEGVARCASYIIDLHSGGIDYRFLPLVGFYGAPVSGNPSFDAARHFGLEYLWQLPETSGVLSFEAWKLGITAIGTEYLGAAQLTPDGVAAYADGVLACLTEWGIAQPGFSIVPRGRAFQGDWQLAAATGIFQAQRALGDSVKGGDILAEILDVRGRVLQRFTSATAGIVLGLRSKAWIRENDWGVLMGVSATNE